MATAGAHRRTARHANLASLVVWPPWADVRVEPVGLVAVGLAAVLAVEPLAVG